MKIREIDGRSMVCGEVGDRLPDDLLALTLRSGWKSGQLSGIGGVKNVELAYFDLAEKRYVPIAVDGVVELVGLTGNLAMVDRAPFWHLHAIVSDRDGQVRAGHLVRLEVAITLECWLQVSGQSIERKRNEATGLNLLDL